VKNSSDKAKHKKKVSWYEILVMSTVDLISVLEGQFRLQ
jgi:hypothetical protein